MIVTPDVEMILPEWIEEALTADWSGLYVSRTRPRRAGEYPYVVTVQKSGGVPKQSVLDQIRLQVCTWTPTELDGNAFAEAARSALEACSFRAPFKRVTASVPVPVNSAEGEPPQRFFTAEAMVRRTTTDE